MVKIKEYFEIGNYTIKDGLINTDSNVLLIKKVKKLPVQFGHVGGKFNCYDNKLTSLEGAPQTVSGTFSCSNNKLTSLKGAPKSVGGNFYCSSNKLTSLKGAPQTLSGYFDCYNNQLTSLEGSPKSVGGGFYCRDNQLTSLVGSPNEVGGDFYLTWIKNLPLLQLVRYKRIETYNDQINEIINKYCNHKPLKEAILLCQKELIDNGFIGNASW
jgi:hypothetical protein